MSEPQKETRWNSPEGEILAWPESTVQRSGVGYGLDNLSDLIEIFQKEGSWVGNFDMDGVHEERLNEIFERLGAIEASLERLMARTGEPAVSVEMTTFAPEAYIALKPIPVLIERVDESYVATFLEANIAASGATRILAVENLKAMILDEYEMLVESPELPLARKLRQRLTILLDFVAAKD